MLTTAGQPEWRKECGNTRKHTHLHAHGPGDSFTCWPLTEQGIITGCTINGRIPWWPCSKTALCWGHNEDGQKLLGKKIAGYFYFEATLLQKLAHKFSWNSNLKSKLGISPIKKTVDEVFRCESHRSSLASSGEGGTCNHLMLLFILQKPTNVTRSTLDPCWPLVW